MSTLVERIHEHLHRIEQSSFRDAIVLQLQDSALEQAALIDSKGKDNLNSLPLAGLTFVIKDNIDVKGQPTKVGSPKLPWPNAKNDAWVVDTLKKAGAVLLGKAHMNEFAAGLDGINSHYPRLGNPRHPNKLTGGSSSGSAVAVAAGLADFAVGTDTGGSVRIPACWNGLWGLRLATDPKKLMGVFPRSPSLDALGLLSKRSDFIFRIANQLSTANHSSGNIRIGYDPRSLSEMNGASKKRFLKTIEDLIPHVPIKEIDLNQLLAAKEQITKLLKAEFHRIFNNRFKVEDVINFLGSTVAKELASSGISAEDLNNLREEHSRVRENTLRALSREVNFILSPLCLHEARQIGTAPTTDDRHYTVGMSLLGCPVLSIPYRDVADGYQLVSLDGMSDSFESLALKLSELSKP